MPMYQLDKESRKFYEDYYGALLGGTIVKVTVGDEDEEGESWPSFTVISKDGVTFECEVSRAEEGNGPGFLFGLPTPQKKEVLT